MRHPQTLLRLTLLTLLLTGLGRLGRSPITAASQSATPSAQASLGLPPEVRLRKLHLVRPDLIPYPIMVEIVC